VKDKVARKFFFKFSLKKIFFFFEKREIMFNRGL
jgi:hypothetical protein